MEPLNSYRLNKIMLLTLGCVDIAMYAASGYLTATAIGIVGSFLTLSLLLLCAVVNLI
jgi:hypothetical protein